MEKVLYNTLAVITVVVIRVLFFGFTLIVGAIIIAAIILWFSWFPALICWFVWGFIAPTGTVLSYLTWLNIVIIVKSLTGGFGDKGKKVLEILHKIELKLTNIKP